MLKYLNQIFKAHNPKKKIYPIILFLKIIYFNYFLSIE